MNALLKAILKEAADLYSLGEAVLQKKGLAIILPALIQAGTDASGIASNASDLSAELNALLTNPAADADLLAYATGLVGGDNAKAQKIIAASAKLALDVAVDVNGLIQALKTPATA